MRTIITVFALVIATNAAAQEAKVVLKDGPGKDKAMQCAACHSLDYIPMNSRFLDKAGWTASINKMINAFGAPISKEDVEPIADYLAQNYGKAAAKSQLQIAVVLPGLRVVFTIVRTADRVLPVRAPSKSRASLD